MSSSRCWNDQRFHGGSLPVAERDLPLAWRWTPGHEAELPGSGRWGRRGIVREQVRPPPRWRRARLRQVEVVRQVAGDHAGADAVGPGVLTFTDGHAEGAARMEAASRGRVDGARHVTLEHLHGRACFRVGRRGAVQERHSVGMTGFAEHLSRRPLLRDLAQVHDGDRLRHRLHHGQVVSNEQVSEPQALLQLVKEDQDASLHGHIQCGGGFVEDHELGIERERARDGDPLALPPTELVRPAPQVLGAEPDHLEQRQDTFLQVTGAQICVGAQGLRDEAVHGHARVERGIRVLEDDLGVPQHLAACTALQPCQVAPHEADAAGCGPNESENCSRDGRLAAA